MNNRLCIAPNLVSGASGPPIACLTGDGLYLLIAARASPTSVSVASGCTHLSMAVAMVWWLYWNRT